MRVSVPGARLAGVVWLALAAGCYRYVPLAAAGAPALEAGTEVRLHLTPEGSARVGSALGAPAGVVTGRAERVGADSLSVLVSETAAADAGARTRWVGERVTLPVAAVARGERRLLDRRRSLLVGGGVVLAAAAGYALLRSVGGGGAEGGQDPGVVTP